MDHKYYEAMAASMGSQLAKAVSRHTVCSWIYGKNSLNIFRSVAGQLNIHATATSIHTSFNIAADALIATTSEEFCTMMRNLSSDFVSGEVLDTIVAPTPEAPNRHIALKRAMYKADKLFQKDKEFVYLEYVDVIQCDKRQVAFRALQSIDIRGNNNNTNRSIAPLTGLVFYSTDNPEKVELSYLCSVNSDVDSSYTISHVEQCFSGILKHLDHSRNSHDRITVPHIQILPLPSSSPKQCYICERAFHWDTLPHRPVSICLRCMNAARRKKSQEVVAIPSLSQGSSSLIDLWNNAELPTQHTSYRPPPRKLSFPFRSTSDSLLASLKKRRGSLCISLMHINLPHFRNARRYISYIQYIMYVRFQPFCYNKITFQLATMATDLLHDVDTDHFVAIAKHMTHALLDTTNISKGLPWKLVYQKQLSIYRTELCGIAPCNVHATTKLAAEIEDVTESLITTTTESYKTMMTMLSSDFIDGAVLANVLLPTPTNPYQYIGLKWAAFKSLTPFTKDKDFVILEYIDMIEDKHGTKTSFRIMQSVEIPTYIETPGAAVKYTRESVPLVGFIYYTTKKPGELKMTYTCNIDKNGDLPTWAANAAIQSHVEKCLTRTLKYIEYQRMSRDNFILPQQVIPLSDEQDHCHVCQKKFSYLYRHRYNCLKCGKVICSNCSSLRTAEVPDLGERKLRVCTACVIEVRLTNRRGSSDLKTNSDVIAPVVDAVRRRSLQDILQPVHTMLDNYQVFSGVQETLLQSFPNRSSSDGRLKAFRQGRRVTLGAPEMSATIAQLRQNKEMRKFLLDSPATSTPTRYHRRRSTVGSTELASVISSLQDVDCASLTSAERAMLLASDSDALSSDSSDSEYDDECTTTTDDESLDEKAPPLTENILRQFNSLQSCIDKSRKIMEATEQSHKLATIVRRQSLALQSLQQESNASSRKSSFSSSTTVTHKSRVPTGGAILFDSTDFDSRMDDDMIRLREFQASQAAQRRRSSNDIVKAQLLAKSFSTPKENLMS
ncbi:sporangia induced hypothetical protein [Thraustotheca clavata]|uniref:FYVE-type domain-containing protein n=1 Tax=Thraustotheca clavata TaxID=74557 RepID=A0A1V9ZZ48_9STRA|nr:sporangia induced hypothetical protein [Thraustotheca clavata]